MIKKLLYYLSLIFWIPEVTIVHQKTAYLAGPMRGYEEFNFPAFHAAADELRLDGWKVFSPAERDLADGFDPKNDAAKDMAYYMAIDLPEVCQSDTVFVLPGWKHSQGARLEVYVGRECNIPIRCTETYEVLYPKYEQEIVDE